MDRYILVGHEAVPEPDLLKWAKWFETAERIIDVTYVTPKVRVSTVFLGLDHGFGDGPPVLFETMVFRRTEPRRITKSGDGIFQIVMDVESLDEYTVRSSRYEDARIVHRMTVSILRFRLWQRLRKRKTQTARFDDKWGVHAP